MLYGKKLTVIMMVLFLVLGGLACSAAGQEETESQGQDSDERILQELDGKRFGVQTGSTFDKDVLSWFPNAQIVYYNSLPDLVVALQTGKIDAFPSDAIALEMMNDQNDSDSIRALKPFMDEYSCGFVFAKTPEGGQLRDLFDEWMSSAEASGQLEQMMDKWLHAAEEDKTLPEEAPLELILTQESENGLDAAIKRIFSLETRFETSLSNKDKDILLNRVLAPQFGAISLAEYRRGHEKVVFKALLKEQVALLEYLEEQNNAIINGLAGTGKTVMAKEKALRHADKGEKVLFLCYNSVMK